MAEIVLRPLARTDDRSGFACGNIELDRFFQRYAGQNHFRHHIGTTHVVAEQHVAGVEVAEQAAKQRLPVAALALAGSLGGIEQGALTSPLALASLSS
jgi:hypothetical protein